MANAASAVITMRIEPTLDARFAKLAHSTHRTKSFFLHKALSESIDKLEATYVSEQRLTDLREGKTSVVPLEEVLREFNVEG